MSEIDTYVWIIGAMLGAAFIVFIILIPKSGFRKEQKKRNSTSKEK